MHGYNLIKEFKQITGRRLKPAVIYPFLHTLEEKGYIVGTWMVRGKRKIKSYEVTQKGRVLLRSVKSHFKLPIKRIILDLLSTERIK
jgi:PadR family transcriptional regulator PadR